MAVNTPAFVLLLFALVAVNGVRAWEGNYGLPSVGFVKLRPPTDGTERTYDDVAMIAKAWQEKTNGAWSTAAANFVAVDGDTVQLAVRNSNHVEQVREFLQQLPETLDVEFRQGNRRAGIHSRFDSLSRAMSAHLGPRHALQMARERMHTLGRLRRQQDSRQERQQLMAKARYQAQVNEWRWKTHAKSKSKNKRTTKKK